MGLQTMTSYGYEILQALVVDIKVDDRVKMAMNEVRLHPYSHACMTSLARCTPPRPPRASLPLYCSLTLIPCHVDSPPRLREAQRY